MLEVGHFYLCKPNLFGDFYCILKYNNNKTLKHISFPLSENTYLINRNLHPVLMALSNYKYQRSCRPIRLNDKIFLEVINTQTIHSEDIKDFKQFMINHVFNEFLPDKKLKPAINVADEDLYAGFIHINR